MLAVEDPNSGFGDAGFFARDGLGVDEPLCLAGTARLVFLNSCEAAHFQKAANFFAWGIEYSRRFLGGKPAGSGLRHFEISSGVCWASRFTVAASRIFLQSKKNKTMEKDRLSSSRTAFQPGCNVAKKRE